MYHGCGTWGVHYVYLLHQAPGIQSCLHASVLRSGRCQALEHMNDAMPSHLSYFSSMSPNMYTAHNTNDVVDVAASIISTTTPCASELLGTWYRDIKYLQLTHVAASRVARQVRSHITPTYTCPSHVS